MTTTIDDLDTFRAAFRRWLAGQEVPSLSADYLEVFEQRRRWQRTLFAAGWLGLSWPAEYGGRGKSAMHQVVFNEELAAAGAPGPIGTSGIDVIGPTIIAFGSEEQKSEHLARILSAENIWCQGFSEPDSGSDLASLSTYAERVSGGFVVNGRKIWSTWSHMADFCALLARTDRSAPPHRGISYLLVSMAAPGVSVRPIVSLNGESEFGEITFEDVRVPDGGLLGELNAGWGYAMHTLSSERSKYAMRRTRDMSTYLAELLREIATSGRPWSDAELVSLGYLRAELYGMQAQCERAASRASAAGDAADPTDSFDKVALTRLEQDLLRFVRDLLGPFSNVAAGTPGGLNADRWVRRYLYSRMASVYGGSAQIQRNIIGERILGLPNDRWQP